MVRRGYPSRAWPRRQAWLLLWNAFAGLAAASPSTAADIYVRATADTNGVLRIERARGPAIVVPPDSGQVGADAIGISKECGCVGWVALYPNCCTSYPVALALRVYANGRARTFDGDGLTISRWAFTRDGKRVAFREETVHGGFGVHYEQRDVASGRLVAAYDPPAQDPPGPSAAPAPGWVAELDSDR